MIAFDRHLAGLRKKVRHPCNLAMLDYLLSLPERRIQQFTLAPFCTPMRLAAFARVRAQKPRYDRDVPLSTRIKRSAPLMRPLFRGGWKQTTNFIVFISENRAHRQFLAITSGRSVSTWFSCS